MQRIRNAVSGLGSVWAGALRESKGTLSRALHKSVTAILKARFVKPFTGKQGSLDHLVWELEHVPGVMEVCVKTFSLNPYKKNRILIFIDRDVWGLKARGISNMICDEFKPFNSFEWHDAPKEKP